MHRQLYQVKISEPVDSVGLNCGTNGIMGSKIQEIDFYLPRFKYAKQAQSKFNKPKADTKERADHGEDCSNGLSFCGFCVLKAASHHRFCGGETFLKEMKMKRCN
ncbi:hypothetical protein L1887_29206 [Cichorium endivia]|nr:hypothetical protein L1887_29206 [Cichorium endivia]